MEGGTCCKLFVRTSVYFARTGVKKCKSRCKTAETVRGIRCAIIRGKEKPSECETKTHCVYRFPLGGQIGLVVVVCGEEKSPEHRIKTHTRGGYTNGVLRAARGCFGFPPSVSVLRCLPDVRGHLQFTALSAAVLVFLYRYPFSGAFPMYAGICNLQEKVTRASRGHHAGTTRAPRGHL